MSLWTRRTRFDKPKDKRLQNFCSLPGIDKTNTLLPKKWSKQSPYWNIGRYLNNTTGNSSTKCRNVFTHCLSSWKTNFFSKFRSASNGSPGQVHCSFDYLTRKCSTEYRIIFGQCSKCSERKRVFFQEKKFPSKTSYGNLESKWDNNAENFSIESRNTFNQFQQIMKKLQNFPRRIFLITSLWTSGLRCWQHCLRKFQRKNENFPF